MDPQMRDCFVSVFPTKAGIQQTPSYSNQWQASPISPPARQTMDKRKTLIRMVRFRISRSF